MKAENFMSEKLVREIENDKLKTKNTRRLVIALFLAMIVGIILYGWLTEFTVPQPFYTLSAVIFAALLWYDIIPFMERKFEGKDMYQRRAEAGEFTFVQMLIKYLEKHPQMKDLRITLDALSERVSRLEKVVGNK